MKVSPRPLPIALSLLLAATTASCEINLGYRIMTDGFRFDYEGDTALREDAGAIPDTIQRLEVDHIFGEVEIAAADGADVGWSWSLEVWADSPEEADLVASEIAVIQRPVQGGVRLELDIPEGVKDDLNGVKSTLLVSVPRDVLVELENSHGDARVRGIDGETRLVTRHGDVRLEELGGAYTGEHAHGELFATHIAGGTFELAHGEVVVRGTGPLRAQTRHADVTFETVDGDLELDAAHGDVQIHTAGRVEGAGAHGKWRVLDAQGLRLRASHGDITARLVGGTADVDVSHGDVTIERDPLDGGGHSDTIVRCSHGDVEIDLPAGRHADVEVQHGDATLRHSSSAENAVYARARHGEIRSDLPVAESASAPEVGAVLRTSHGDVRCVRIAPARDY